MKNLAQQEKGFKRSLGESLQNQGLSMKQVGDDHPYPGLKEALKESSMLLNRIQLQILQGESWPVCLLPEEIIPK